MTSIPDSHRLAERAVLRVCTILNHAGALAERIRNDYGEDLLVQTHLKDTADNFHLLVQVKGKSLTRGRDGTFRVSIDVEHIQRWASHIQSVLVCILDSHSDQIFAFSPRERFSLWSLATTKQKSLTIRLSARDVFNEETAAQFVWNCRLENFARMLVWYDNAFRFAHLADNPRHLINLRREATLVTWHFLKSVGVITRNGRMAAEFRHRIQNAMANFAKTNAQHPENPLGISQAIYLCLLAHVEDVQKGVGLPGPLLEHGGQIALAFFKKFHREELKQALKKLSKNGRM